MQDKFWTPELWCEFLEGYSYSSGIDLFKAAEQFKSSKSPKKEWEIVAFGENAGEIIHYYTLQPDGRYRNEAKHSELSWPAHSFTKENEFIHSVRRLSDGEVFSVGDNFLSGGGLKEKIISFEIHGNDMWVWFSCGSNNLQYIKKLPQPILTTVDGVEIRENEECWIVDKYYKLLPEPEKINEFKRNYYSNCFIFSTREAAEKYTLDHAPKLSLNDVKDAFDNVVMGDSARYTAMGKLTTLVKQKLNQ